MPDLTASSRWAAVRRHLAHGRDLAPADRADWLATLDDDAVREEVAALLEAEDRASMTGFLSTPAAEHGASLLIDETDPNVGREVGPWRLAEKIGEGGMGVVYRAERADGLYEQTVALKLIARGIAPEAMQERFRQERRILARLAHPGIARLVDGGVTAAGQPYFAMELAEGEPLMAYAEVRQLDVPARLALVLDVCDAVAHAHRHLVVHRDLKPSNVLVASGDSQDGASGQGPVATQDSSRLRLATGSSPLPSRAPRVKLLDFGIAKLLGDEDDADLTRTGALLTPAYAAPEQVRGEAVTAATDVYALGVLLYEMLAGQRPYDVGAGTSPTAVERTICETDPPPPSSVAPASRARRLRGDLDTIVAKALRKAPAERYASAEALADDLRRHLAGLPITARPATVGYRVASFVRRHTVGVVAAGLVALAVALGMAGTVWQAREAASERDRAQAEADKAAAVNEFLIGTFASAAPDVAPGDTLTALDVLERGAKDVETRLADQPVVQAEVTFAIAAIFLSLGQQERALPLYERALALRREHLGDAHEETGNSLRILSFLQVRRGQLDVAESLAREAVAVYTRALGEEDPRVARALTSLARVQIARGESDAALESIQSSVSLFRRAAEFDTTGLAVAYDVAGALYLDAGQPAEAQRSYEQRLELERLLDPSGEGVSTAVTRAGLARSLRDQGQLDEAERLQRDYLAAMRRTFGDVHPNTLNGLVDLGTTLLLKRQLPEAEALFREGTTAADALAPPEARDPRALAGLAEVLVERGRYAEAADVAQEALTLATAQERATEVTRLQRTLNRALSRRGTDVAGP